MTPTPKDLRMLTYHYTRFCITDGECDHIVYRGMINYINNMDMLAVLEDVGWISHIDAQFGKEHYVGFDNTYEFRLTALGKDMLKFVSL